MDRAEIYRRHGESEEPAIPYNLVRPGEFVPRDEYLLGLRDVNGNVKGE
ncbi:MAG: hypothetical protein HYW25_05635 [Candidatus Aenigmarchaeota archaeon]|nr:hypothetical protein [Candidatus Aenigmarchaeota archaeon]